MEYPIFIEGFSTLITILEIKIKSNYLEYLITSRPCESGHVSPIHSLSRIPSHDYPLAVETAQNYRAHITDKESERPLWWTASRQTKGGRCSPQAPPAPPPGDQLTS